MSKLAQGSLHEECSNETTESAALVGLEPVATVSWAAGIPNTIREVVLHDFNLAIGTKLCLAATVEQLVQERDSFYMDYRMKCDVETKALHEQLAAMTQERDALKEEYALCRKLLMDRTHDMMSARHKLAASQAREQQLREGLTKVAIAWSSNGRYDFLLVNGILESTSTDDTALRQWGAKLLREMAAHAESHIDYPIDQEDIDTNAALAFHAKHLRRKANELENKK